MEASIPKGQILACGRDRVQRDIKFLDEAGEYVSWHGRTHFTGDSNESWCEIESVVPEGAAQMVLYWRMHTNGGWLGFTRPTLTRMVGAPLIEDGAITTDKIATGAITAESGIIGSINAGTITVGEMDGARIKARTIAADKVLIGSQANAIADDEFFNTAGSPHWDLYQSYTDEPMSWSAGKPTIKASAGAGLSTARYGNDGILPCEPGEHWRLRFQKIRYSPVDEVEYNANIEFLDAAGNHVSWHGRTHFTGELNQTWCEIESIVPEGASQMHLYWRMETAGGDLGFTRPTLSRVVGATLIQNGAITTDKILANAITAGKIAALAIEADHISANAITADKIHAGAIDGKLITGARIRTAASGRRTELDVEGLTSYKSNGAVVLTTNTSDGSIDMTGRLTQTIGGNTIVVGGDYNGGPGIQWSDSNIYAYPPGIRYGKDADTSGLMTTLVQGPGVTGGSSFLQLNGEGKGFGLEAWQTSGDNRWVVTADVPGNYMRVGSGYSDAPYMSFTRGTGDTGNAWIGYRHPTNGGHASMSLKDRYAWLGSYDSNGNTVGFLKMDATETV
ncbi:MAG: hypothetical protein L0J03_16440, partial [Brevibacterium sp.]|nr:hypothetical protein [Brevibacterium sp.]